ncbi:anaerobic sulfite reductase subunit AsrB [Tepidibacter formicigenes]|jgi:anaerobic sulfite reductase subunit B|uniref:Anaerobic sulfite reductase subunit B n=1 Tax=Tepidibacter formicigenes DSM 15518 TaxID=1123349 RepID=A0A1M6LD83_9FIRM|nr:anaerobic sulfite reductase subunit AsrB [Tepidibacter formicigenes]SHJ69117.1 anaerobic sulfite reductase subunit B [Tepidibacter formicigenes DSM 15518]
MNNNPFIPQKKKVLDVIAQTDIDITYKVEFDKELKGGQFLQVSIPKVGEAPISVSDFGDGYIEMTIRKVGKLTNEIYNLKPGDYMYLRGPYGNGFPIEKYKNKHLIIAAGGTGLAPVKNIINYFHNNIGEVKKFDLLMGFKSPKDILFKDEIEKWKKNIDVILTVDNGDENWSGNTGLITKYVPKVEIESMDDLEVVIVGPPVMMKFTALEFLRLGVLKEKIWVSFERKMSCAIGKCGHCKVDETYVCLEGPVFNYTKAENLID